LGLFFGSTSIQFQALFDDASVREILWEVRLPRVLLGLFVGAGLGASGAALQAILRNPLADPFILGVSGGAALGGTVVRALSIGLLGLEANSWLFGAGTQFFSVLGALAAVLLTFGIAKGAGGARPTTLLLAGVVLNAFCSALILFLRSVVSQDKAQELLYWLVGSLGYPSRTELVLVGVVVSISVLALSLSGGRLNVLSLSDLGAGTLGVDSERARMEVIIISSVVVGVTVSLAGLVGFVGLMVPHLLRLIVGPDHRLLVPLSALGGGAFLVLADLLARVLFRLTGTEAPVGVVTAFLGGPFFLFMLRRGLRSPAHAAGNSCDGSGAALS